MMFNLSVEELLLLWLSVIPIEKELYKKIRYILKKHRPFNWILLLKYGSYNNVLPQIYFNIKNLSLEEEKLVPDNILKILESSYFLSTANNIVIKEVLKKIIVTCSYMNIEVMPLKGFIYAEKIYPIPFVREMRDIDLMIPQIIDEEIKQVLINNISLNITSDLLTRVEGYINYNKINVIVDIHSIWNNLGFWKSQNETNRIWKRSTLISLDNLKIPVMSSEDLLLMTCYHSLAHLKISVRDLCDINALIKLEDKLDWDYILKTANRTFIVVPLYCILSLIKKIYEVNIPINILIDLEKNRDVKLYKNILRTWRPNGGFFDFLLLFNKELSRARSLGLMKFIKLNFIRKKLIIKNLMKTIKNRRYEPVIGTRPLNLNDR